MARQRGTVKWFSEDKGFGFITPDGAQPGVRDLFVHYSAIEDAPAKRHGKRNLTEGATVEYDVTETAKGPQAERVRTVE